MFSINASSGQNAHSAVTDPRLNQCDAGATLDSAPVQVINSSSPNQYKPQDTDSNPNTFFSIPTFIEIPCFGLNLSDMTLPVLRLRVSGYCSPIACTSTDEEKLFARAASELQSVPIVWYRKVKPKALTRLRVPDEDEAVVLADASTIIKGAYNKLQPPSPRGVADQTTAMSTNDDASKSQSQMSSIPQFFQRQISFFQNGNTSASANNTSYQSDENSNTNSVDAISRRNNQSEIYTRFEANLSLCDTESGPAIELRTTCNSKAVQQILKTHDLSDIDRNLDDIMYLYDANEESTSKKGIGNENANAISDVDVSEQDTVIERIIPLEIIDNAAQGGTWDWSNMLNVNSGNFDCGIKVYSCKSSPVISRHETDHLFLLCLVSSESITMVDLLTYLHTDVTIVFSYHLHY